MKVYVVSESYTYEGTKVIAVCSSKDKAEKIASTYRTGLWISYVIEEIELDEIADWFKRIQHLRERTEEKDAK